MKKGISMNESFLIRKMQDERDNQVKDFVLIPLAEAETMFTEKDKKNLAERFWNVFRKSESKGDETPNQITTDSGMAGKIGIGDSSVADQYYKFMELKNTRNSLYEEYERMDRECCEARTALNVTVSNVFMSAEGDQESHKVVSDNDQVLNEVKETDRTLEMNQNLPQICRSALKYGDEYEELVADGSGTLIRLKYLNPKYTFRNEDAYGRLKEDKAYYMEDDNGSILATFYPWQVIHTRFEHERGNLNGSGFYYGSRLSWRKHGMMEDGVVIRYLTRASKRYAYYLQVPKNMRPEQLESFVSNQKNEMKRKKLIDSDGKLDLRRAPFAEDEDIFIPVDQDSKSRVEMFDSGGLNDNLTGLNYFMTKVLLPTRVPKAYIGLEEGVRSRATLGWQDIEFARMIRSVQRMMSGFQRRVYNTQLIFRGIPIEDEGEHSYKIIYPAISFLDEQMRVAINQMRWAIVSQVKKDLGIPLKWLLQNIVQLNDTDITEIINNLEPVQQQGWGGGGGQWGQADQSAVREVVFSNMRLQSELLDLRDKLHIVITEKLHVPLVA
jgi:hypothetical protein